MSVLAAALTLATVPYGQWVGRLKGGGSDVKKKEVLGDIGSEESQPPVLRQSVPLRKQSHLTCHASSGVARNPSS
ncbi:hypothetical protein AMTR_s00144p00048640 [Amborella trichopoda]|uniref:Uncharacterized protein n=1 Tax=Amborella trichopoda TaxID=13333 RepID=W1P1E1_AMBTC|nr:hypothetical protein AMTR_s00144p00048640 [Amborella trichopoda]